MYKINKIRKKDIPSLKKLYEELVIEKSNLIKMNTVFNKIEKNKNYFLLGIKNEDGILLGSIMGIVCYDLLRECHPFMVMENMIVDTKYQGKGIGKLLLTELETIAKKHGCIFIQFCSSSFRTGAHNFYYSMGYSKNEVKGFRKFLKI